ncbi:hypothetical protein L226DRAFT_294740 [Lentinus tigrinus ALCF2SS1-7]|uniref:uncharacterized protein n=1 Tax=Lentinus tigrinus ALCF2SS1-7 TaxID=1328758 RepID=UPI001165E589|nr:hypothetical protein L226DRAFT_294740 [Lentinus tigrinus ALCF2SS1-7]
MSMMLTSAPRDDPTMLAAFCLSLGTRRAPCTTPEVLLARSLPMSNPRLHHAYVLIVTLRLQERLPSPLARTRLARGYVRYDVSEARRLAQIAFVLFLFYIGSVRATQNNSQAAVSSVVSSARNHGIYPEYRPDCYRVMARSGQRQSGLIQSGT